MARNDEEFRLLLERVFAGSEEAAAQLLTRYGPAILYAVRRRLHKQLRSKFDSIDFVQDVWVSFFANPPTEHLFDGPEKLVAFLTQIARNKIIDVTRLRLEGRKYNVNREQSLDHSTPGGAGALPAVQPTPSEVVSRDEQWDRLLNEQPPVFRRILVLAREGREVDEIAEVIGIHPRTVRRVIDRVLARLQS